MTRTGFLLIMTIALGPLNIRAQAPQSDASGTAAAMLVPMPREYSARNTAPLLHGLSIRSGSDAEDRFTASDLETWFKDLDIPIDREKEAFPIRLLRANSSEAQRLLVRAGVKLDPPMHEEGYVILPSGHGLAVIADTGAGLFYGAQTLKQMVVGRGRSAVIDEAQIRDWPAMRYRGLSDDLSRGPIPTLEFEEQEIRTLAAYKMNLYSPYFENTLAYASNPLPALPGESLSAADAKALVAYAHQYHMMIVPEQEAFGHLHHVLIYEQYAPLAETPLGSVLAPGQPGSVDLIGQWFTELAHIFPAPFLHIGADETFDLGTGQTKAAVKAQGLGAVYVDFLIKIHDKLAPLGKRLLFWGDIAMNDPDQVKRLPKDMIAVAWVYSPEPGGYQRWLEPYLAAGMETWVAPGVSNWSRVYPDNDAALRNIQRFVSDGQAAHSTGMLNTVWNDDGEGLSLENWYGVLFGAAAAWQPGSSNIEQYQAAYGQVFHGDRTGDINQAQRELIAIDQLLAKQKVRESTDAIFWADPWSAQGQVMARQLEPVLSELRLHAERAITLVAQARAAGPLRENDALDALDLGARKFDFIGQKFETADQIARTYRESYTASLQPNLSAAASEQILQALRNISGGLCLDMRDGYSWTRAQYSTLWLKENRPYWLRNVLVRYDLATQLWVTRGDRLEDATRRWSQNHSLPAPEELGIPAEPGSPTAPGS